MGPPQPEASARPADVTPGTLILGCHKVLEAVSNSEPHALASGDAAFEAALSRPEASAYGSIGKVVEVSKLILGER